MTELLLVFDAIARYPFPHPPYPPYNPPPRPTGYERGHLTIRHGGLSNRGCWAGCDVLGTRRPDEIRRRLGQVDVPRGSSGVGRELVGFGPRVDTATDFI